MTVEQFGKLVAQVTDAIQGRPIDKALERELNARFPAGGAVYESILSACRTGAAEGWMCNREAGGIKFGRVVKPGPETHGFSVDVVEMADVAGPHHVHPKGEIDLIMPLEGDAKFDSHGAGWFVYEPGSAHRPTVNGGRAYVLYLLPDGEIQFTKN